ncbi:hypothetical protein B7463_g3562, partial [Scytalidium lignicola]
MATPDASDSNAVAARDEKNQPLSDTNKQLQPVSSSTLLPSTIASVVSLVTRSSSIYLRLGTSIGSLALDGARITTLTGLELSRAVIEGVLTRAGRDVADRSNGDLGRAEAEGILERSIATLHSTITSISFAASTGFHFSSATLASASDISQQLLSTLDSILGSTDSSRAIASIITLIQREFQNPATGVHGEKVGVVDLLLGICGLALLQRWSKKLNDTEARERKYEHTVWDVVVLDNERRADVVDPNRLESNVGNGLSNDATKESTTLITAPSKEIFDTIERGSNDQGELEDDIIEVSLKERLMRALPPEASVSITTSITTTKTITVDITGTEPPDLSPPPGVEIVEENAHHASIVNQNGEGGSCGPRYRVVYRILRDSVRGTTIKAEGHVENAREVVDESDDTSEQSQPTFHEVTELSSPEPPRNLPIEERSLPPLPLRPSSLPADSPVVSNQAARVLSPDTPPKAELQSDDIRRTRQRGEDKSRPSSQNRSSITPAANQKRPRKSASTTSSISGSENDNSKVSSSKVAHSKRRKEEMLPTRHAEKKGSIRNALRKGSGASLANLWNKDSPPHAQPTSPKTSQDLPLRPPWGAPNSKLLKQSSSRLPVPQRNPGINLARQASLAPQRGNPNYFSSKDLGHFKEKDISRSPSMASYYSVHELRRDSIVSQTDRYSIHSIDVRPGSPTALRSQVKAQSSKVRTSEKNTVVKPPLSPMKTHQRNTSYVPSIYTLNTNNSETSLVLASNPTKTALEDPGALESLSRTGFIDGVFPHRHFVANIARFVRFASASYGSNFLRVMGIAKPESSTTKDISIAHHHEHSSFSSHTQLPADTILLSSFVDPQGGTDSSGNTNTGIPMVHFVSLDHDSRAVVLTCRGTLGFEDVLTDLTCDYDELLWRGKRYSVHKGIYASARRLLNGAEGRVMATIKAALEEFPDYGLVMCGHSLGGGVTAVLAIMISEPAEDGNGFVTAMDRTKLPVEDTAVNPLLSLPSGRPIHVYSYGPPSTISPSLRLATRNLITTIVNGQDLVPYLSLGVLHDLQAVALAFKNDDSGAKAEVKSRVWGGLVKGWYGGTDTSKAGSGKEQDDEWAFAALKVLRSGMLSPKLVPPGEVFIVECENVLARDAFVVDGNREDANVGLGRLARRSTLKYVRNVERKFGELRTIKFSVSNNIEHAKDVKECYNMLQRSGSFKYVRRLVIDGTMKYRSPVIDNTPIEEIYKTNDTWKPLADLIKQLPALTDLIYKCPNAAKIDDYELKLATSPSLHTIHTSCEEYDNTRGRNQDMDYKAAIHLLAKLAPNLREVFAKPWSLPLENTALVNRRKGFLQEFYYSTSWGISVRMLEDWRDRTEKSVLNRLEFHCEIDQAALEYLATNCKFESLTELVVGLGGVDETRMRSITRRYFQAVQHFLCASIPPRLSVLELNGHLNYDFLDPVLSYHGQSLSRLKLHPVLSKYSFVQREIALFKEHCPLLEELMFYLHRSKGDAAEVDAYRTLGSLPKLQYLRLMLDASNSSAMYEDDDDDIPLDDDDERLVTPNDPSFDEFDQQFFDWPGTYRFPRNGHLRDMFINCALDEALASAIFRIISSTKLDNNLRPLEKMSRKASVKDEL